MIYSKLKIEPTNLCNLRCPLCPTNNVMSRARGSMSFSNFKKIIDQFKKGEIKNINLWNFGEPLLNKDLPKMVEYANRRGIKTVISTNSTILNKKRKKEILSSGLSLLIMCLDGITKEVHEKYRVGSKFEKIVSNIKEIVNEKNLFNSKTKIRLQMLLTKDTEGDIENTRNFAKKLGVDELVFKDLSLGGWTKNKKELSKLWLPRKKELSRYKDYDTFKIKNRNSICKWHNRNGTILWNSDVTICCYDFDGDHVFTNINKENFRNFLLSEAMDKIRTKIKNREFSKCKECQETEFKSGVIKL